MDTLCLDALPAEILLRIASLGPAENLLSLQLVCHRLHDTLFDTIVFRELLEPEKVSEKKIQRPSVLKTDGASYDRSDMAWTLMLQRSIWATTQRRGLNSRWLTAEQKKSLQPQPLMLKLLPRCTRPV